jgi:hypothetical protein
MSAARSNDVVWAGGIGKYGDQCGFGSYCVSGCVQYCHDDGGKPGEYAGGMLSFVSSPSCPLPFLQNDRDDNGDAKRCKYV